jgi:hypothetical protein
VLCELATTAPLFPHQSQVRLRSWIQLWTVGTAEATKLEEPFPATM